MNYSNEELKALSDEALVHAELQLDRDLVDLRFKKNRDQLRNVNQIKEVRRNIARTRTEQRRRELEANAAKNSLRDLHRASFKANVKTSSEVSTEGSTFGADMNEQVEDAE